MAKKIIRVGFYATIKATIITKLKEKAKSERRSQASIVEDILEKELCK